jgi:hypothetical protein
MKRRAAVEVVDGDRHEEKERYAENFHNTTAETQPFARIAQANQQQLKKEKTLAAGSGKKTPQNASPLREAVLHTDDATAVRAAVLSVYRKGDRNNVS